MALMAKRERSSAVPVGGLFVAVEVTPDSNMPQLEFCSGAAKLLYDVFAKSNADVTLRDLYDDGSSRTQGATGQSQQPVLIGTLGNDTVLTYIALKS